MYIQYLIYLLTQVSSPCLRCNACGHEAELISLMSPEVCCPGVLLSPGWVSDFFPYPKHPCQDQRHEHLEQKTIILERSGCPLSTEHADRRAARHDRWKETRHVPETEANPWVWALTSIVDRTRRSSGWSFVRLLIALHDCWLSQNGNMQSYYMWSQVIGLRWSHLKGR